jgi:hypothetical protein
MGDLALVSVFFSMILFPCAIATRSLKERDSAKTNKRRAVFAVDETEISDKFKFSRLEPRHDRRALALLRSRELYYRERSLRAEASAFQSTEPAFRAVVGARPILVDRKVV